jgi:hypothetical protein
LAECKKILFYCGGPSSAALSEILDTVMDLFGFVDIPEKGQATEDFPESSGLLVTIDDAGVPRPVGVQDEEVFVLSEEDAALGQGVGELVFVGGVQETRLGCRGHIDAPAPEAFSQRSRAMLIQVEANRL